MYNYEWDIETGGYNLTTKITGVSKEVRPVFSQELRFLGLDRDFGWDFPDNEAPLMWAEARRYIYKGEVVAEAVGGGLYDMPTMKKVVPDLQVKPVDVEAMVGKNSDLLNGLVQQTLRNVYDTFLKYKNRVGLFYMAFSAGKDSVVALDIVQRALPQDAFVVVFCDTTMEAQATYDIMEQSKKFWSDLEWYIARAPFDATESWNKIGYPARKLRWCCSVHKTAPSIAKLKEIYDLKYPESKDPFKVMVFDGIRAEESEARSNYLMVSEGNKHAVQFNCSPLLEWNTTELFMYIFANNLPINDLYRYGAHRVGCKLCPMASDWYECVLNHVFPEEVQPLIDIVSSSLKKQFKTKRDEEEYLQNGGWKSRIGGRDIFLGENKITEIKYQDKIKYIIKNGNYRWDKWMAPVGDLVQISPKCYGISYKDISMEFEVEVTEKSTIIEIPVLIRSKTSIRFMYIFKNALNKSAYCVNCRECVAECAFNALSITDDNIEINNCRHCEACMDSTKGCIVAKSLGMTGEGNNMSTSNISRYQNFGFRQDWLELFFEKGDEFWENENMGKYMLIGFKTWLKEAGITENNALSSLGTRLCEIGSDSLLTWGTIYVNLAYNAPIINWYIKTIDTGREITNEELTILLGDQYSPTTKKNALSSLKETFRLSPIGEFLGQGFCEMKGKQVIFVRREEWLNPEPLVILYTLYLFAEHSDGLYSFTLSDLLDDREEREAMSPKLIFGTSKEGLKALLQGLANNYSDFINVDFNKGIMENIFLDSDKKSVDVVQLM